MAEIILAIIGSNGLFAFITYMITRHDGKNDQLKKISDDIKSLSDKVEENNAVLARTHILRFSDELENGVTHSKEYFRQQMDDCDTYDAYCKAHPDFRNSYTVEAEQHIKDTYHDLLRKGVFKVEN